MNYSGIIVGAAVFFSIGLCHPAVIKMEYYWGRRSWCCRIDMLYIVLVGQESDFINHNWRFRILMSLGNR